MNFIGKNQLEHWGEVAARDFLTNQTPLNEAVEKIAHEYSLNGEQIKRVCEFANISTNLSLFKQAEDKRFEFRQACHQYILESLDNSSVKEASTPIQVNEYDFPLNVRFGLYQAEPLNDDISGSSNDVSSEYSEKLGFEMDARELSDHPDDLLCILESKQEAIRELECERDKVATYLEECRDTLTHEFKQSILDGEATFSKIAAAGVSLFSDPYEKASVKEELIKIGYCLHQQGALTRDELTKLAYSVPDSWISEEFDMPGTPVLVQNGRKTTWAILDTLVRQRDRPADYDKPLLLLNDDVKYLKQVLSTGEDLDLR
jgi:hypothetical protein